MKIKNEEFIKPKEFFYSMIISIVGSFMLAFCLLATFGLRELFELMLSLYHIITASFVVFFIVYSIIYLIIITYRRDIKRFFPIIITGIAIAEFIASCTIIITDTENVLFSIVLSVLVTIVFLLLVLEFRNEEKQE